MRCSEACFRRPFLSILPKSSVCEEMLAVYCGKCLSRKAFQKWVGNVLLMTKRFKRRYASDWDNRQRLLYCRFRCSGKAIDQVYQCCSRICREIDFFLISSFEYHIFYVLYSFVTHLPTLRLSFLCTLRQHQPIHPVSNPVILPEACTAG
jgi:hypothetical protein